MTTGRTTVWIAAILGCGMLTACGGGHAVQTQDAGPLTELATAYLQATQKLDRAPKGPEELQEHLAPGRSVDSLLKSPNDGQPYVILWGTDPRTGMDLKPLIIGYESSSSGGARVVFTAMGVSLMGDEDFKTGRFPEGHTPK